MNKLLRLSLSLIITIICSWGITTAQSVNDIPESLYLTYDDITNIQFTEATTSFGPPLTIEESETLWLEHMKFEFEKSLTYDVYPFIICDKSEGNSGFARKEKVTELFKSSESDLGIPNSSDETDYIINTNEMSCIRMSISAKVIQDIADDEYVSDNVTFAPIGFSLKLSESFYEDMGKYISVDSKFEDVTLIAEKCPGAGMTDGDPTIDDLFSYMEQGESGTYKLESDSFFYQLVENESDMMSPKNATFWHEMITEGILKESNGCKDTIESTTVTAFSSNKIYLISFPPETTTEDDGAIACTWSSVFALALNPDFCSIEVDLSVTISNNESADAEIVSPDKSSDSEKSSSMVVLPPQQLSCLLLSILVSLSITEFFS